MKKYVAPVIEIENVATEDIMSISANVSVTQNGENTNAGISLESMWNSFTNLLDK